MSEVDHEKKIEAVIKESIEEVINPLGDDKSSDEARLKSFIERIYAGSFDGRFEEIERAMNGRREERKKAVIAQVREVFGANYEVSALPEPLPVDRPIETNPFLKKGITNAAEVVDNDDEPISDALDSLAVNDIEKQMIKESATESLPIEQRGAIIGGLSASDMGD